MKRLTNIICFASLCMAVACNDASKPADSIGSDSDTTNKTNASTVDETPKMADSTAIMQGWMAYSTPGEMHAMLAKANGTWDVQTTMWMTPDGQPMTSTGTMKTSMVMGGRYQQSIFKGDMMGQPFEGVSLVGYDNFKKKFVSTWYDNMGTGVMMIEGTWDAASKTMNFSGTQVDPTTGKEYTMRETYSIIDDNTQKMVMYAKYKGGQEFKSMEMNYKRKK